jgi:hypothetical protein
MSSPPGFRPEAAATLQAAPVFSEAGYLLNPLAVSAVPKQNPFQPIATA